MSRVFYATLLLLISVPVFSQRNAKPGIHEFVSVDKEPVILNLLKVKLEMGYPIKAQKAGIEGIVYSRVLVSEEGKYLEHDLTRRAHPILNQAVNRFLPSLEFIPAKKNDRKVKYWMNIPFYFKLTKETKHLEPRFVIYRGKARVRKNISQAQMNFDKAVEALKHQDNQLALICLSRSINMNPSGKHAERSLLRFNAHLERGKLWLKKRKFDQAEVDFTEAIGIGIQHSDLIDLETMATLYFHRGGARLIMMKYPEAFSDFQWIISSYAGFPKQQEVYEKMGIIHLASKHYHLAKEDFILAKNLGLSPSLFHFHMGSTLMMEGDFEHAEQQFSQSLTYQPVGDILIKCWNSLAELALLSENPEKALNLIQNGLETDTEHPLPYYSKGLVMEKIGGDAGACSQFKLALDKGLIGMKRERALRFIEENCGKTLVSND
ncbi:MAG: energy transducer TonB [Bacteroidota bacterium]